MILAPFPVSKTQPESTRRMIDRLQTLMNGTDPATHPYLQAENAELLKKLIDSKSQREALELMPVYAETLLKAGDPEGALREFSGWQKLLDKYGIVLQEKETIRLLFTQALCGLRIGEQENCLIRPTTAACILPIRQSAVHQLPRGSRMAVDTLTEILFRVPNDLSARWLINVAYMTLGEYPDKVPSNWLIPPSVFASEYNLPEFPDVAGKLGLDVDDLAGGVVIEDFDGDGFLDIMVSSWSLHGQLRVFRNNGDGTFTERTVQAGLAGLVGGLNMIQADYNNDGHPDVLILRGGWEKYAGKVPNSLLRNNGDFTFTDVTEEAGLLSYHPTQTAVWFDFNGDGLIDLFIGNESADNQCEPCELYRNNGDGTFTECAAECGLDIVGFVKGVASDDYNRDGRPDLFISRRSGTNMLLRNDGPADPSNPESKKWKFTDVSKAAGVDAAMRSFPCWFWDYDNDGWPDIMVTGYYIREGDVAADYLGLPGEGEKAQLYHNNHDGTFTEVSKAMGISRVIHAMGVNFGDLDNDGWLDFYAGTGDPGLATVIPNRAFRNAEGKKFQDVTTAGGFGVIQKGHAVAFGDINNDGFQDIYEVVGGAVSSDNYRNMLFSNPGNKNHWLKLTLDGVRSNRSAIGARVKIVLPSGTGEREIYSTVGSGASFGASSFRREIGLGQADRIIRVEVFWPATGKTQVFSNLQPDHLYKIREDSEKAELLPLKSFPWPSSSAPDKHHGW